jgi:hypothetical protein
MRITVACPQDLISDANHLAMCLALSEADGNTYGYPNWQDAGGNLYAAASFQASTDWITFAQSPLVRPTWDVASVIDMDAASRAQAVLAFSTEPVLATPVTLTAIGGMGGVEAIESMGLAMVQEPL